MGLSRFIHELVNVPFIKRMITGNRTAVRLYFDWKYRRADPYGLLLSDYEKTKLDKTAQAVAAYGPFDSALEIGCGEGGLTVRLAPLARSLLAVDVSGAAAARARERLRSLPHVRVERKDILVDDLGGPYDLVAASEVLYYLGIEQIPLAAGIISAMVKPGGWLLLAHARALADDASGVDRKSFGARTIHGAFLAGGGFTAQADIQEPQYRITLLRKATGA